jgi:hypothetical protein
MLKRVALFAASLSLSSGLGAALARPDGGSYQFASLVVRAQNNERAAYGFGAMAWDPALARAAAGYAAELAATDKWEHSDYQRRVGQGENLWMGTRSAFTLEQMVGEWLAERKVFRPGVFPNVTTTANWGDVGHYTQIIWPETLRVGCALRSSAEYDYLVCRYSQPGNVMGQPLRVRMLASR